MAKSGEKSAEIKSKRRAPLKIGGARHLVMGIGAAVIMFAGGVLLGGAMERYFEWLSALADPPPAFSPLGPAAFERSGLAGEIGLVAQIDSPRSYFVDVDGQEAFVAPLYPPQAAAPSDPVEAVLLEPAGAPAEEDFANWIRAVGPTGVIVEFLGKPVAPDETTRARIAEALAAEGLRLSSEAVFVDPHHRSRRRELAPQSFGMTLGGSVIGLGALLGFVALRSAERERRRTARRLRREAKKTQKTAIKTAATEPAKPQETKKDAPRAAPAEPAPPPETQADPQSKQDVKTPAKTSETESLDAKKRSSGAGDVSDANSADAKDGADPKKPEKAPPLKITGVRSD